MSKVTIYSHGLLQVARRTIPERFVIGEGEKPGSLVSEQIEIYVGDWEVASRLRTPQELWRLARELDELIIAATGARAMVESEMRLARQEEGNG